MIDGKTYNTSAPSVENVKRHPANMDQPAYDGQDIAIRDRSGAKKLFTRRVDGLAKKMRDLILRALFFYGIEIDITMILEFDSGGEVSMFRSHRAGQQRWWRSLDLLRADCVKISSMTDHLDPAFRAWMNRTARNNREAQDGILEATLPLRVNNRVNEDSESHSDESSEHYSASEDEPEQPRQQPAVVQQSSPQRVKRERDESPLWQSPPGPSSIQPPFSNGFYPATAAPTPVPMHPSMYGNMLQNNPSMTMLPQNTIQPDMFANAFTGVDPSYQQVANGSLAQHVPDVSPSKKRKNKGHVARRRTSARHRAG